jgi:hypothetical protein
MPYGVMHGPPKVVPGDRSLTHVPAFRNVLQENVELCKVISRLARNLEFIAFPRWRSTRHAHSNGEIHARGSIAS